MLQEAQQLDPQAVALSKAIRQTESGGNFHAKGKSGEYGAYQYTEPTWQKDSASAGVNVPLSQATPEQQNEVAYKKVKSLKDSGKNPGQIASIWNSGDENAYTGKFTDGRPAVGVNSYGVKYDVPAYAKSVATAYQTLKGGGQVGADPQNPSSTANINPVQPQEDKGNILSKLMDFAFPIVSDVGNDFKGKSTKSPLQQIGDLGLSALWFAPGVGEVAEGALQGTRAAALLGEAGTKVAGQAIGGAGLGYGADVASNLSQGKTGGEALTPGLGTATGGLLGGALGKVASKYGQEGVLSGVADSNNSIIGQSKKGAADLAESFSKDRNQGQILAQKGINLSNEYNPETVAYETAHHAQSLRNDANTITDTLTEALKGVQGTHSATELENELVNKITSQAPDKITAAEQAQLIKDEFAKVRSQYGEELSVADMNELKKRAWNLSKFDAATPNATRKTQRLIGNALKTKVESAAEKSGVEGVGEINDLIGQHLDAADSLDRLHGAKAKGGRLGDTMQRHTLETLGGVGGFFGGGPVGSLIGLLAGHYGSPVISRILRYAGSSPIKTAILKRITQEDPEILQKLLTYAKQTPQGLEAIKEQLGQQGISISDKLKGRESVSPVLTPKKGSSKLTSGLLKGGLRLSTPASQ